MRSLPPCPYLPTPRAGLDWRILHAHRGAERGDGFYRDCLEYGHALWRQGLAARALLCLDRAFGAELRGDESVLREMPLPYVAMAWLVANSPTDIFIGNPRVHFQHYADRMNEPRREQRRWRAWGCWALVREVRPEFPPDFRHFVNEPSHVEIEDALNHFGHGGEGVLWRSVLERQRPAKAKNGGSGEDWCGGGDSNTRPAV